MLQNKNLNSKQVMGNLIVEAECQKFDCGSKVSKICGSKMPQAKAIQSAFSKIEEMVYIHKSYNLTQIYKYF